MASSSWPSLPPLPDLELMTPALLASFQPLKAHDTQLPILTNLPVLPPLNHIQLPVLLHLPVLPPLKDMHLPVFEVNTTARSVSSQLVSSSVSAEVPSRALATSTRRRTDGCKQRLPLGHPGRLKYVDTISEAFSAKYKKQKRNISHRTWCLPKKCKDCKLTYPSKDEYNLHRLVYHSDGLQINHACPVCGNTYKERRWLNRHVRNAHFKFMCKIDNKGQNLNAISNGRLRRQKKSGSLCAHRFSCEDDLKAHQAIVHGLQIDGYEVSEVDSHRRVEFMEGSDSKYIVVKVFKALSEKDAQRAKVKLPALPEQGDENIDAVESDDEDADDLMLDLCDITQTLCGDETGQVHKNTLMKKKAKTTKNIADSRKTKKKPRKAKSPTKSKSKSKSKSPSKSKSKSKSKKTPSKRRPSKKAKTPKSKKRKLSKKTQPVQKKRRLTKQVSVAS